MADKNVLEKNVIALEKKIKTADEILSKLYTDSPQKMMVVGKVFEIVILIDFTPKDNNLTHTHQFRRFKID